jgi:hypothetical protein
VAEGYFYRRVRRVGCTTIFLQQVTKEVTEENEDVWKFYGGRLSKKALRALYLKAFEVFADSNCGDVVNV